MKKSECHIRKIQTTVVAGILLGGSAFSSLSAAELYVSLAGDDRAGGAKESPLKTLAAAQERVRQLKADGMPAEGIQV